jgi:hypothetical protein
MNPNWKDLAEDWYPNELLKDGIPIESCEPKHKVPRAYSRADLPIHAKSGRERGPDSGRSPNGPRDDEV